VVGGVGSPGMHADGGTMCEFGVIPASNVVNNS